MFVGTFARQPLLVSSFAKSAINLVRFEVMSYHDYTLLPSEGFILHCENKAEAIVLLSPSHLQLM